MVHGIGVTVLVDIEMQNELYHRDVVQLVLSASCRECKEKEDKKIEKQ